MTPVKVHPHVEAKTDEYGRAVFTIENTNLPCARLYRMHQDGITVDAMLKKYFLPPAHILSGLAFAYDNAELLGLVAVLDRRAT